MRPAGPLALFAMLAALVAGCADDPEPREAAPRSAPSPAATGSVSRGTGPGEGRRHGPFRQPARGLVGGRLRPGAQGPLPARAPGRRRARLPPDAGAVIRIPPGGGDPATFLSGLDRPHDLVLATVGGRQWIYVSAVDRVVRYPVRRRGPQGRRRRRRGGRPAHREPAGVARPLRPRPQEHRPGRRHPLRLDRLDLQRLRLRHPQRPDPRRGLPLGRRRAQRRRRSWWRRGCATPRGWPSRPARTTSGSSSTTGTTSSTRAATRPQGHRVRRRQPAGGVHQDPAGRELRLAVLQPGPVRRGAQHALPARLRAQPGRRGARLREGDAGRRGHPGALGAAGPDLRAGPGRGGRAARLLEPERARPATR